MSSFVCHSFLLTTKGVNLAVARDGLPFKTDIVRIFHSDYFHCRDGFQTVLDSYIYTPAKCNGHFTST